MNIPPEASPQERRRTRMVHHVGITIFLLILLSALAGLLGKGPLSKVEEQTADATLRSESCRFIRYQAPMDLKLQIAAPTLPNGLVELRLSKNFVDDVEIEHIQPEPETQTAGPKFYTYAIRVETNAPSEIRIRFAASHFGRLNYQVRAGEGEILHLQHFVFP